MLSDSISRRMLYFYGETIIEIGVYKCCLAKYVTIDAKCFR